MHLHYSTLSTRVYTLFPNDGDSMMHQPSPHAAGGAPHAQAPPPPLAVPATAAKYVCDGCGQTFDRKFNLDRHKQRKVPCTQKLDTVGQHAVARLLCTVLDVLRGPLNLSEQQAKNDELVTRILIDLWAAVALAADKYPERGGLVHRLVVEQLNSRQVTLLFSVVLVAHHPPTPAMIQTLRALYAQMYHQQESAQQQGGTATRQRLASKLQGMWLLEALR